MFESAVVIRISRRLKQFHPFAKVFRHRRESLAVWFFVRPWRRYGRRSFVNFAFRSHRVLCGEVVEAAAYTSRVDVRASADLVQCCATAVQEGAPELVGSK